MIDNPFHLSTLLAVPPVFGIVWAAAWLVPAAISLIGAGVGVVNGRSQQRANRDATRAQTQATDRQLEFEREREAQRRADAERSDRMNAERWQAEVAREQANNDRLFAEDQMRDRRREPYRAAGRAAVADLDARRQGSMADIMPVGRI